MAQIDEYVAQIRTAVYGRDVRTAIANGIEEIYAIANDTSTAVSNVSNGSIGSSVSPSVIFDGIMFNSNGDPRVLRRYAVCGTAGNVANKTAIIRDGILKTVVEQTDNATITHPYDGAMVTVFFTRENTHESPTLNISTVQDNSSSGAYPIYYHNAPLSASNKAVLDGPCNFMFYSYAWHLIGGNDAQEAVDLSSYLTQNNGDARYIQKGTLTTDGYLTKNTADTLYAPASTNSFKFFVCSIAGTIPYGVKDINGTTGTLLAAEQYLHTIFFVRVRNEQKNEYDAYMVLEIPTSNGSGQTYMAYSWEKLSGSSSDLSAYLTKATADNLYASYETHSFEYVICVNSPGSIPTGIKNVHNRQFSC